MPRHSPCALLSLTAHRFQCVHAAANHARIIFGFFFGKNYSCYPIMFTSLYLLSLFSSQGTIGRIRLRIRFCMRSRMRFTITAFFTTFVVWWAQCGQSTFAFQRPLPFRISSSRCHHFCGVVGSSGLEPPTSRLSGVRSNHLSYEPISVARPGALAFRPTCWWR